MAVALPVETWVASLLAGQGIGQSQNVTVTVNITQAWGIKVPIKIFFPTNVSAGPQILPYRSSDGGNSYDTIPTQPAGINRQSGGSAQITVTLDTGQYAIQILSGGGSSATWTIQVNTQEVTTAILNS